jgi:hypothetical protein
MTRRERFWRRVYAYAETRICALYLDRAHHDRCCPNCNTWGALGLGFDWHKCAPVPDQFWLETLPCKQCGHVGTWDCRGILPVPVNLKEPTP